MSLAIMLSKYGANLCYKIEEDIEVSDGVVERGTVGTHGGWPFVVADCSSYGANFLLSPTTMSLGTSFCLPDVERSSSCWTRSRTVRDENKTEDLVF